MPPQSPSQPNRNPRRPWMPAWAWAALTLLLLFAGYTAFETWRSNNQLATLERRAVQAQQRSHALESEKQLYGEAVAIVADAATKKTELRAANASLPSLTAYWNPTMGLVLAGDALPALSSARTLQLWIALRDGAAVSAAIFRPNAAGQALVVVPLAGSVGNALRAGKSLSITEEPAGGSVGPTSKTEWTGTIP